MSLHSLLHIERISAKIAKPFVIEHHYSHGIHNGPMTWGLFVEEELVGVIAFATPSSENVRDSVFGPGWGHCVTELHRLVLLDWVPRNSESFFIVRALRALKKERDYYRAVLSFADAHEGHLGTIYQATNAQYTGMTAQTKFWRDETGKIRHPRQNGYNTVAGEASTKGLTPVVREGKHRYLYLLGDRREVRQSKKEVRLPSLPYPHFDSIRRQIRKTNEPKTGESVLQQLETRNNILQQLIASRK